MHQSNESRNRRSRHSGGQEPLAVIGLSARFPGAANAAAFWQLLRNSRHAITEVPASRWNVDDLYDPNLASPGKMNTRWGGFVEHIEEFDPLFFGISPREASTMDPQQRLMLEVSWEAFEDAGLAADRVRGTKTGVFVGIFNNDYQAAQSNDPSRINAYYPTGTILAMAANRVSHVFDLRGPSLAIDTACSSSLVAVHLACQSLRTGECDMALAGGVNVILAPYASIALSQAWMMATDGRCKSFDAGADGYVRGEGCGVVVLKRLEDAQRDGNRILAVIRGTAVNQDGRGAGLTAPSGAAQEAVIRQALDNAGVTPSQIDYVEAHGVGTPLADAVEIKSLAAVLGPGRPESQPCLIGSVKSNIGHLETAAGISSLIKVILCLQHGEIPPLLHLNKINPELELNGAPLQIVTQQTKWPASARSRIAGVHSFGLGGTNAHVIVEQAPASPTATPAAESHVQVLTLSAKSEAALKELARRYHDHITHEPGLSLADICYTANTGRARHPYRLAIKADSIAALEHHLQGFVNGVPSTDVFEAIVEADNQGASRAEPAPIAESMPDLTGDAIDAAIQLFLSGADAAWEHLDPSNKGVVVSLPTYPFERRRCWFDPPARAAYQAVPIPAKASDVPKAPVARAFQPAAPRTPGKSLANGYKRPGGAMADPLQPSRRLELAFPGSFRGLKIGSVERQAPGRGQVEIRVHAAGLNYRDLMVAMNVYPGGEVAFGGECAGTITRVGEGVVNFAEGDEVIAVAHGAFADYVRTRSEFVVMKPPAFSFAESATLPVTFLTAHYAINHLARIRAGERILIHAGAGGVGVAAVQLALQAGAEVLATAGNDAKRAFLQELGVKHTFSSRSLEFAEQVMQSTEGRGVDVVLNSLAGEFIPKSLSVMAHCGRFLEIGKRDICENTPLGMEIFKKNTAFFGIDLDLISQERPEMIQSLLLELLEWFNRGELKPLPLQAFAIEEAIAAFRHMAKAKHIGKVVLTLSDDAIDRPPAYGQPLDTGLRDEILAADAEQRLQILESHIREQLSRALGISPAELDLHASLAEIGLDSLMALELKNRFEKQLEIALPVSTFLEGRSIAQLTRNISDLFDSGNGRPGSFLSAPPEDDAGDLLARLDSLSDANVDQLLDQLMKEGAPVHG